MLNSTYKLHIAIMPSPFTSPCPSGIAGEVLSFTSLFTFFSMFSKTSRSFGKHHHLFLIYGLLFINYILYPREGWVKGSPSPAIPHE